MNMGIRLGVRMAVIQCVTQTSLFIRNYMASKVTTSVFLLLLEGGRGGGRKKEAVFETINEAIM